MKTALVATLLGDDYANPFLRDTQYTVNLYSGSRQLLVAKCEVVILVGATVSRKLVYDSRVVAATYTTFNSTMKSGGPANQSCEALVVCLEKHAHVYYPDGRSYVVSFPFTLLAAVPFESGVLLERAVSVPGTTKQSSSSNEARFMALVDPILDLKVVGTSSISTILPRENLACFPPLALDKSMSLCATFNPQDQCIHVYHIRTASRAALKLYDSNSTRPKRKPSLMHTPNPSRVMEDEVSFDLLGQHIALLAMDKKRTSTMLSDVSSMVRMPNDLDPPKPKLIREYSALRKDMILSRTDLIPVSASMANLRVFNMAFDDKEAIVVCNLLSHTTLVNIYSHGTMSKAQAVYTFNCNECIPMAHPRCQGYLLALKSDSSVFMVNPFVDVTSPPITVADSSANFSGGRIKHLIDSYDDQVAIKTTSGASRIMTLVLQPSSDCVESCLNCLKYLLGSKVNETLWMIWRVALMIDDNKSEWDAFVTTILVLVYPFQQSSKCLVNDITRLLPRAKKLQKASDFNYSFQDLTPYITMALHLLREEWRLSITESSNVDRLGLLLTQLTTWMGWPDNWSRYYMYDYKTIDQNVKLLQGLVVPEPPNLFKSLVSLFGTEISHFVTYSQLVEEAEQVNVEITPRTHFILKAFELIVSEIYGSSAVIELIQECNYSMHDIEQFPPGVCIPLKDAVLCCQVTPNFEWSLDALDLIGRRDLCALSRNPASHTGLLPQTDHPKNVAEILSTVFDHAGNIEPWDGQDEADRINITKLIFDYDRRYFEITTLLHQTKPQTARLSAGESASEYDLVIQRRELAALVALRTLAIPLGRAALFYATRKPLLTEKFPISKFNLNTLVLPTMTNIVLDPDAIPADVSEWGYFHNGAAAGLSICKDTKGVTGSWIIFNKPLELNAQHAGFLLGLGLNGYLKSLEEWHIYNYLGPKHPLTSVGLLIGMAASIKRLMDNKLTKVLLVHAVALLPQGANDLNVPIMVQMAGLVGIGLLYLESQHRRMSEILLTQISGNLTQGDGEHVYEGYRLCAGLALGFVNLGKGDDLRALNDTHVVDKLLLLGLSTRDKQPEQEPEKCGAGALVALGLIFLRTENALIASKLAVPLNEHLMDYVRPDLLLLRCLGRNLVMWLEIGHSRDWVDAQVPALLLRKYLQCLTMPLDSDQIPYLNILGGQCLSIGIKYASSHLVAARDTLLHYYDEMNLLAMKRATTYDQRLAAQCARHMRNLVATCVLVVMAGLGDLEVLRRLRALHHTTGHGVGYGDYMAISAALGYLFLGGGQYAFAHTNFAVACLVASMYPVYPQANEDTPVHLQALRHFWALLVEPRCLVVREIGSNKPVKLPVVVSMRDGKSEQMLTPCLLPHLSEILEIRTNLGAYFEVKILLKAPLEYADAFFKNLTIYVYKQNNHEKLESTLGSMLCHRQEMVGPGSSNANMRKLLHLDSMQGLSEHEQQLLDADGAGHGQELSLYNILDDQVRLAETAQRPQSIEELWSLRLLFAWADKQTPNTHYIKIEFVERLKRQLRGLYP